jgi:hypothetical protein
MKKKKNYLKTGILLLGIFILVLSCEKEENQIQLENRTSEILQSKFNLNDYSKMIPYDYEVNWSNPTKLYSNELKLSYYEFSVNYTSILNPIELNKQKLKSDYYIKYKILVTEKNKNDFNFYAIKFYQKVDFSNKNLLNSNVSFSNLENYTGIVQFIDIENDLVFAKRLNKGILANGKSFKQKEFKDPTLASKEVQNCITLMLPEYTDWYKKTVDPDGSIHIEFTSTQFTGFSNQTICYSDWIPEYNPNGGNSDGIYLHNGDAGVYKNETIILIENEIITAADNPPDCESFNYSRVGATDWQCAAVSGVHELFTVFGWNCNGVEIGYLPQTLYFQLPINSTYGENTGHTSVESAVYLQEAFEAFDSWYQGNACTASGAVMTHTFIQYIKDEFEERGGNVILTPPLGFLGATTPYKYTWSGYGDCN